MQGQQQVGTRRTRAVRSRQRGQRGGISSTDTAVAEGNDRGGGNSNGGPLCSRRAGRSVNRLAPACIYTTGGKGGGSMPQAASIAMSGMGGSASRSPSTTATMTSPSPV